MSWQACREHVARDASLEIIVRLKRRCNHVYKPQEYHEGAATIFWHARTAQLSLAEHAKEPGVKLG